MTVLGILATVIVAVLILGLAISLAAAAIAIAIGLAGWLIVAVRAIARR